LTAASTAARSVASGVDPHQSSHPLKKRARNAIKNRDHAHIRTDHAPANFTTLKHIAHNLIRRAPGKDSFRLKRKVAAWDDEFLARLIAA